MPFGPTSSIATLRPELGGSLQQYDLQASRLGFVGLQMAPVIEVAQASGIFGRMKIGDLLKDETTERAVGGHYNRSSGDFDNLTFATKENGFEEPVDDRQAKLFVQFFDAEVIAAMRTRDIILRNHEKRVALLGDAIPGGQATAATALWSAKATADPVQDVTNASVALYERTGLVANMVMIPWKALQVVKNADNLIDRIKFTGLQDPNRRGINLDAMAAAFDVARVVSAGAQKNTANEALAAVLASVWTDTRVIVARVPETADPVEPGWARTYHWGEDGSTIGTTMETYRDEPRRSDIVRGRQDTDEKIVYAEAAQVITGVL